ncbi:MAG: Clp protease ClpP [Bacteroidales bacterium]|nr:Clp protease ClpP [Bacteroidales bacterium]
MNKPKLINQTNSQQADIYMYGIIGRYMDVDINYLIKELEQLRKAGVKKLFFYVNCDGGEVVQGQTLWAYLDRNDFDVTFIIDGIAASIMAMILTNPKFIIIANPYSKFMYHRVQGGVNGNSDEVRSYADMMDKFEADLVDMFSKRTKLDPKKVKKEYFGNQNKWLNAEEARDLGLVNEIREGNEDITEPQNLDSSRDVYQYFENQLTNCITKEQNMKKVALLLNLSEDSTEQAVQTAVQNLINTNNQQVVDLGKKDNQITELNNTIKETNTAKVKNLIDGAIEAKKFGEDMRESYTEMAVENYDRTEKIISKMSGVKPVIDGLEGGGVPDAEKNWKYDDYFKANKLENLKNTNQDRFAALYKEKFNREYKA